MIYIFDFDYTLFDTEKFREKLSRAMGISREEFRQGEEKILEQGKNYNLRDHLELLPEKRNLKTDTAFRNLEEFVYEGAVFLLEKLKESGEELILLSLGDSEHQKKKIQGSGMEKYFSQIIITEKKEKANYLQPLANKKVFFINDNSRENREVKEKYPHFQIYEVESRYSSPGAYKLKDLLNLWT